MGPAWAGSLDGRLRAAEQSRKSAMIWFWLKPLRLSPLSGGRWGFDVPGTLEQSRALQQQVAQRQVPVWRARPGSFRQLWTLELRTCQKRHLSSGQKGHLSSWYSWICSILEWGRNWRQFVSPRRMGNLNCWKFWMHCCIQCSEWVRSFTWGMTAKLSAPSAVS